MGDQISGLLSPFLFLPTQRMNGVKHHLHGQVLDFGCGIGALCRHIPADKYTGVDLDWESVDIVRRLNPSYRFFTVADFSATGPYDTIVSLAVIEHVESPADFLSNLKSMLAPGGKIVISTPNPALDWAHYLGASVCLFSRKGHEEHKSLLNRRRIAEFASEVGLRLILYRRFLFAANQLAVYTKV